MGSLYPSVPVNLWSVANDVRFCVNLTLLRCRNSKVLRERTISHHHQNNFENSAYEEEDVLLPLWRLLARPNSLPFRPSALDKSKKKRCKQVHLLHFSRDGANKKKFTRNRQNENDKIPKKKYGQMINDLTSILLLVRGRGGRSKSAASACVRERMKETWCATWITVGPANVINGRPTLD